MKDGTTPWERLKALFREAFEKPEEARRAFLDGVCEGRPELRAEVEELLAAHQQAGPLLEAPLPAEVVRSALAEALSMGVPRQIGRYRIRRLIASGGMGAVYEAEQESPRRAVAVKVLRRDVASPSALRRFEHEAELLARLQHPAIAQVFEAGMHDDGAGAVPYFALEYLERARPITEHGLKEGLPARARLELFATLCDAVHHGHQRGIIHRDLKPSNVLVDGRGQLKIIDFGIARCTDSDVAVTTLRTEVGQLIGTIQYMSPEQCEADPQAIDTRSDVYSLGVLLYELLSGRMPYDVSGLPLHEATRVVRMESPRKLGAIDARWRGDVETIAAKALEKDRERRYRSAAELADDVRRHLAGEAIAARPATVAYQLRVFARRNKALVGGVMGVLAALLIGIIGTVLGLLQANAARQQAEGALFDMVTAHGLKATELGNPAQGLLWFSSAADIAPGDAVRQLANRVRLLAWRRHVVIPLHAFAARPLFRGIEFHPDGSHLVVVSLEGGAALWDLNADRAVPLPGGRRPVTCAAWSPDGERLALGLPQGQLEVFAFPGGERLHASSHAGGINTLAFSPGGRHLAIGSDALQLWDAEAGRLLDAPLSHPAPVVELSFNDRGDRLATASRDETARVFAVPPSASGAPLFPPMKNALNHFGHVKPPVFLAGGRAILTLGSAAAVDWRDAETGELVRTLEHHDAGGSFVRVAASPDGKLIVTCGTGGAQLWDASSGRAVGPPLDGRSVVGAADFSPDGTRLLTGAIEDHSTVWSVPDGAVLTSMRHQDTVAHVRFSPDGRFFATAQNRGLVRVWRLEGGHPRDRELRHEASPSYVALSRDERFWRLVGSTEASGLTETQVREASTGQPVGQRIVADGPLRGGGFSPDGRRIVLLTPGQLECRDWREGTAVFAPVALPSPPVGSACSAEGRRLAVLCKEGQLLGVDAESGSVLFRSEHGTSARDPLFGCPSGVRYSPDSSRLVSLGGGRVSVWDPETGALRFRLDHTARAMDLSRDGQLLITAEVGQRPMAVVRSLESGQPIVPPLQHSDGVVAACLSPDGELVLTACDDGFARLWDWRGGRLHTAPLEHGARVTAAAFSLDGRWAFTTTHARTLHIWDARGGEEVSPPRRLLGHSPQLVVTRDFVFAPGGLQGRGINVFSLADLELPAGGGLDRESQRTLTEVLAGQRIEGTGVHNLTEGEWLRRFEAVRGHLREPPGAGGEASR
jgi:WD40 repeat protein